MLRINNCPLNYLRETKNYISTPPTSNKNNEVYKTHTVRQTHTEQTNAEKNFEGSAIVNELAVVSVILIHHLFQFLLDHSERRSIFRFLRGGEGEGGREEGGGGGGEEEGRGGEG